jgi:hypothetical protein
VFDWGSGSLKARAWGEVARQRAANPAFRRNRDPLNVRILRTALGEGGLTTILLAYLAIAGAVTAGEVFNDAFCRIHDCPLLMPTGLLRTERTEDILRDFAGYMIGAQTGLLGVLSIAVALVTLIGQRAQASADVRVYYHESFAVPLAGSSLALLMVLCLQLFWPLNLLSPFYGVASENLITEIVLTAVHLGWLVANIALYARFTLISLSFGQDERRSRYRNLYSANVIVPRNMYQAIVRAQFLQCARRLPLPKGVQPRISMAYAYVTPPLEAVFIRIRRPSKLDDVWLTPLSAGVWLWARRVGRQPGTTPALAFLIDFDRTLDRPHCLCRTTLGAQPNFVERYLIRISFRFRRTA